MPALRRVRRVRILSIEDIRALKHAKPFRPFELVTKQGERILISSPIRIALSPTGNSVFVSDRNGSSLLPISEISSGDLSKGARRSLRESCCHPTAHVTFLQ